MKTCRDLIAETLKLYKESTLGGTATYKEAYPFKFEAHSCNNILKYAKALEVALDTLDAITATRDINNTSRVDLHFINEQKNKIKSIISSEVISE